MNIVIDAQRNEVYVATYHLSEDRRDLIHPLRLAELGDVRAAGAQGESLIVGPEATRWFSEARLLFPDAAVLASLVQTETDLTGGEKLEPIYLREAKFVKAPPRLGI